VPMRHSWRIWTNGRWAGQGCGKGILREGLRGEGSRIDSEGPGAEVMG